MSNLELLKFLPLLIDTITQGTMLVDKVLENAKQDKELTPDEEKARDLAYAKRKASPAWQVNDE